VGDVIDTDEHLVSTDALVKLPNVSRDRTVRRIKGSPTKHLGDSTIALK